MWQTETKLVWKDWCMTVLVVEGSDLIIEVKFKFKATDGLCYY